MHLDTEYTNQNKNPGIWPGLFKFIEDLRYEFHKISKMAAILDFEEQIQIRKSLQTVYTFEYTNQHKNS